MNVLREYHAALGELIFKYEGTLDRYAGDGVMILFNAPIQFDDHTARAVRMAVEMRDTIGGLTEKWRNRGHNLGFGIGIALGYATLGQIGFEQRLEYAAIGSVTNLASRLCDEAKANQIVVSRRVYGMVEPWVEGRPIDDLNLKGFNHPILAAEILSWREEVDNVVDAAAARRKKMQISRSACTLGGQQRRRAHHAVVDACERWWARSLCPPYGYCRSISNSSRILPRRRAPEDLHLHPPPEIQRAQGKPGALSTRDRAQKCTRVTARCAGTPGLPCAMVLRLIARSPRRRIPLATVADGLTMTEARLGPTNLHQLDTSHGCQDHTPLPSAASSTKTLRPAHVLPTEILAKAFKRRSSARRLVAHGNPPCDPSRARRCRVHRIPHPTSVTIAIRPS